MKKTFKVFFSLIIILTIAVSVIPAGAASVGDRKSQIYNYLTGKLGFNSAAACGIMANMEHESGFDPTIVARDSNGLLSGGLCMWNGGRFSNLQTYCNNNGYNYLSIAGQLEYLTHELKSDYFKHIYNYLKNVSNSAYGASNAAYYWCYYFEIPGNRAYQSEKRAASASANYWPKYGNTTISVPKLSSTADGKTIDCDKTVKVEIDNVNGNATEVVVLVAKKNSKGYDWDKAKSYTYSTGTSYVNLSCQKLGIGDFAVKAYSRNAYSDKKSSNSNTVKFSIACLKHNMKLSKAVEPTFKKSGSYTYICQKCGLRETVIKEKLSQKAIEGSKVENFKVSKKSTSSITLSWDKFASASGYCIYQKVGNEWKAIKTLNGNKTSFKVSGLKSGVKYSFRISAFVKDSDKKYYSMNSAVSSITKPKAVNITKFNRYENGKVTIGWDKVKNADGYVVYCSTHPNQNYKPAKELKENELSCSITGLSSGTYYYFYVVSFVKSDSGKIVYSDKSTVKFALAL